MKKLQLGVFASSALGDDAQETLDQCQLGEFAPPKVEEVRDRIINTCFAYAYTLISRMYPG